jgi:uncharacterized membrane protein
MTIERGRTAAAPSPRLSALRRHRFAAVASASVFCLSLAAARCAYSKEVTYLFLVWNLFLAGVPWTAGAALDVLRRRAATIALAVVWVCFFPNAPYMVTDLLHLEPKAPVPHWFDSLMLFAFAWAGCVAGFSSLSAMHRLVARRTNEIVGWCFVAAVAGLSGFGIYLGRFRRWNSWDVIADPGRLLSDIAHRFLDPFSHGRTFAVTFAFAAFILAGYAAFMSRRPSFR